MRALLILLALAFPAQAFAAATITITIAAAGLNTSVTKTLTDAEATRVAAYVVGLRKGQIVQTPAVVGVPAVLNPDGSVLTPAVPAAPAVMRDPTNLEAIQLYFADMVSTLANGVTQTEQSKAGLAAQGTVVPVSPK